MDDFKAYRDRVRAISYSSQDNLITTSKRQAHTNMMDSPNLVVIKNMVLEEQLDKTFILNTREYKPSIVSDIDSFYKRKVLFTPDGGIPLGSYLEHRDKTYLVTRIVDDDIYPVAEMEFCNYELLIKGEKVRVETGKDDLGNAKYSSHQPKYKIPCVATSKIYSILDNSQIPLPEGTINIYLPYHENVKIPVNYEFDIHGDTFQVTTVSKINLFKDRMGTLHGYLEIRGQRGVSK